MENLADLYKKYTYDDSFDEGIHYRYLPKGTILHYNSVIFKVSSDPKYIQPIYPLDQSNLPWTLGPCINEIKEIQTPIKKKIISMDNFLKLIHNRQQRKTNV